MRIGIPRESRPGETLVAATAKTASQLAALGYDVVVEQGAGAAADQPDVAFTDAGVRVVPADEVWSSDVVVKVNAPTDDEIGRLRPGATVICLMAPARSPELVERLSAAGVTALAMDAVPRISRAQSMDVLSSMANVAGYRAVIEAAHEFGRLFTGQVTAAGKVPPARVFVVGAGVAGLAAIGAAGSLGAIVRAFDVRPEVAEQVESMGARVRHRRHGAGGLLRRLRQGDDRRAGGRHRRDVRRGGARRRHRHHHRADPGPARPAARHRGDRRGDAPRLGRSSTWPRPTAATSPPPSTDERVVTANGVTVLGYTDLAGRLAAQTSQLYGTNVVNLLKLLTPEKDGELTLDMDDVVQRGITVTARRAASHVAAAAGAGLGGSGGAAQVDGGREGSRPRRPTRAAGCTPPGWAPWSSSRSRPSRRPASCRASPSSCSRW